MQLYMEVAATVLAILTAGAAGGWTLRSAVSIHSRWVDNRCNAHYYKTAQRRQEEAEAWRSMQQATQRDLEFLREGLNLYMDCYGDDVWEEFVSNEQEDV